MSTHTCAFCRIAREMNIAQITRFTESGESPENFLNRPYEDQISSDVITLMIEHDKLKSKENRPGR